MLNGPTRILIVDDDHIMRDVLSEFLKHSGYDLVLVNDGMEAWELLEQEGPAFDVLLIDRVMPNMDGLELLQQIKSRHDLLHIPVIIQTSAGSADQVKEGIEAGAFYYLVKPYAEEVLLAIVNAAVRDSLDYQESQNELASQVLSFDFLKTGIFQIRTLEEARALTVVLAKAFENPERVVLGLGELLINAVEHGNLGITYEEKTHFQDINQLDEEMARRLSLPENMDKYVEVRFSRLSDEIQVKIQDQGLGFNWRNFLHIDPSRVSDTHGRGIAMAKALSFDRLEYNEKGNEVIAVVQTSSEQSNALNFIENTSSLSHA